MATLITRLYDKETTANKAAKAVKANGIPDREVTIVTAADEAAGSDALYKVGFTEKEAGDYAGYLASGGAMLVVRAPFGFALKAQSAVDTVSGFGSRLHPVHGAGR